MRMWLPFIFEILPARWRSFQVLGVTLFATLAGTFANQETNTLYRIVVYGDTSGNNLRLHCGVSNEQVGQTVSWYKDNQKISDGFDLLQDGNDDEIIDLKRYSIDGEYDLTIDPFYWYTAHRDSGDYECRVYNSSNDAIFGSSNIEVVIHFIPSSKYPICVSHSSTTRNHCSALEYFEGDHITLQCQSQPGTPPIYLLWFQTVTITPLSKVTQSSTDPADDVLLSNQLDYILEVKDNGTSFTCKLSQPNERDRFCSFGPFIVYDKPTPTLETETVEIFSQHDLESSPITWTSTVEVVCSVLSISSLAAAVIVVCVYRFCVWGKRRQRHHGRDVGQEMVGQDGHTNPSIGQNGEAGESGNDALSRVHARLQVYHEISDEEEDANLNTGQTDVIANQQVETSDYANTNSGQTAEISSRAGEGRVGDDGYTNLTVEGRDGSINTMYTRLNLVDTTNCDSNQGRVGDDGYALVNLGRREGDAKAEYAHLAPVTDESSVVKSQLVGDDGYANLMTKRHEGDSDPSYAQLSHVGEKQ